jgi:hypothetical protein
MMMMADCHDYTILISWKILTPKIIKVMDVRIIPGKIACDCITVSEPG